MLHLLYFYKDDTNYVEPDICVICDPNKPNDKGCFGAPDWIIEIVSPSSRSLDYYKKLFQYRTAGVMEYWIIDHEKNFIIVYDFENSRVTNSTFPAQITE